MQQQESKKTRRIRQVSVTNLFGIFNHVIPLKMDEHITIIHGPNGFGKTMVLRLLRALFSPIDQLSESNQLLENIPFDEFRVDFKDKTSFWVSKTPRSHDLTEEEHLGKREIVFHTTGKEPYPLRPKSLQNSTPKWLVDMRESVPIRLIEIQHLFSSSQPSLYKKYQKIAASENAITEHAQKIGISDNSVRRIDLLTTIINDLFLFKTMVIDKEKGLVFTTENGISLALENLSSGEQHELVLFYDLLFRTTPGSLILIDEPELSLHVVWQEKFLENLQQVQRLTDIDIIIATHSPDIISDRRDLMVRLKWNNEHGR